MMRVFPFKAIFIVFLAIMARPCPAVEFQNIEDAINTDVPLVLSLEQAVDIAVKNNRDLKSSIHDFRIADRQISETRSQFGFKLKMEGNWQRVHDSSSFSMLTYQPTDISGYFATGSLNAPGNPVLVASPQPTLISSPISSKKGKTLDLTLSKPLLTFGKKPKSILLRGHGRDISELEVTRIENDVALQTREAFFHYLLAKGAYMVMQRNLTVAQDHLRAAKLRYQEGMIPEFDVIRAEVEVEEAREKLASTETAVTLARMSFNNLLGLPVERMTDVTYGYSDAMLPDLKSADEYVDFALRNRVEVRQLQLAREQAGLGADLNRNTPLVSFTAMRNIISKGSSFSSENSWRYVIAYQMDLFDDGLAHSRVTQGMEQVEKLRLSEQDLRQGIILQTHQAYQSLLDAQKRLKTGEAILRQGNKAYEMATIGYEQGVTTEIEWNDAHFGLTQAELNYAMARVDLEVAMARLANAIGVRDLALLDR